MQKLFCFQQALIKWEYRLNYYLKIFEMETKMCSRFFSEARQCVSGMLIVCFV